MGETLGELLRAHRIAASLTQEALAERAAMSATAIAALERGRRRAPRLSTLRQLARALELSPGELAALARAAESADESLGAGETAAIEAAETGGPTPAGIPVGAGDGGVPFPAAAGRRWRTDFVGRAGELGRLQEAWSRRSRLVLVAGEAGIGKTRLVGEFAGSIFGAGAPVTVLWGRCSEEHLGAYLPFVEALGHLVAAADPAKLRVAVGGRGELTRILPTLAEQVGPLPAPTRAEAGTEQRLLFDAVATLLGHFRPMVLVIDDLHWADDATVSLLAYLVRRHELDGVMVVATARDLELGAGHAGRLADLGRHADVVRFSLPGLAGGDLAHLVGDLIGGTPGVDLVDSVASVTGGNPFFAEEMTVHLVDSGMVVATGDAARLSGDAGGAGVPARVRETLARRLSALPGPAIELLLSGAVLGAEFDLAVAAAAAGVHGDDLVEAVDEALLSGLVNEPAAGRLAFSHAMVQNAVASRLSHARRARTHRRVAEALEAQWPRRGEAPVAELARHWAAVAAVDPAATMTAATWAVRAGDAALAAAATDEAIERYTEASALWATATEGHADALVRLGMALQHRGRADEADARFREALALAVALADPVLQARAAIGIGRRYPYWESDLGRISALEDALAALPRSEELLRLTVMGLLVTQLVNGFHPEEARRRDELAAELAAVAADPSTSHEVLASLGRTRIYDCLEDPRRLAEVADRLVDVARQENDLHVQAVARFAQGLAALDLGDMVALRAACDEYQVTSDRLGDPRDRSQSAMCRSTIAFVEGRYDEAAELSDEALRHGKASGDFNAELLHQAQGFLRAVDVGQAADVLPLLMAPGEHQALPSFAAGTALCAGLAGEVEVAGEVLDRLAAEGLAGVPRGADRLAPTAFMAHSTVLIGAVRHAPALIEALRSQPSRAVRIGPLVGWWGPVDHHLGILHDLLGDAAAAEGHLRAAMAVEQRMGAIPFLARTQAALSRVLRRAGGDAVEAAALAAGATAAAAATGAAGVAAEVRALLVS